MISLNEKLSFTIGDIQIPHTHLQQWSEQYLLSPHEEWIADIARTIKTFLDDSHHIEVKTSGSTGEPKVILHSKQSIIKSARLTGTRFGLQPGMTSFNCLPSGFIAGKLMIIRALVLGLNQICVPPRLSVNTDHQGTIDFCAMIPAQVEYVLSDHRYFLDQINCLIIGGAPVSRELRTKSHWRLSTRRLSFMFIW